MNTNMKDITSHPNSAIRSSYLNQFAMLGFLDTEHNRELITYLLEFMLEWKTDAIGILPSWLVV